MPSILKIRVSEARDLPIMDRTTELTDAYVEVRFGDTSKKTDIRRRTLNPVWNEDIRIEVSHDSELQDLPLEFKVWDYDVVSSNDIIGIVFVDVNCLLGESTSQITGWFPIFDSLKGIRGELNITIKVEFFGNVSEFKDTSEGVLFISSSRPYGSSRIQRIHGFVEELIVSSDPEYHWVDNFRASRISNEERQLLVHTLSGRLRRQLGRKVLELNGNSVLGYYQHIDLEGESGIVARGYGTACTLTSNDTPSLPSTPEPSSPRNIPMLPLSSSLGNDPVPIAQIQVPQDVQLITLKHFKHELLHIGGVVMARAVKLLSSKSSQEMRDTWWYEVREEVKSHAKFLGCNCIVGYSEINTVSTDEELLVLTASGTAVVLNLHPEEDKQDLDEITPCSYCHIPFHHAEMKTKISRCSVCKKRNVPEILLTTIEAPEGIPVTGKGCLIEARVCREKKRAQGEYNATLVSAAIPFLEYDLHRQLIYKLQVLGMNAAFGLKFQLAVCDNLIVAVVSATAVFLTALPPPPVLKINRNAEVVDEEDKSLLEIQNRIVELSKQKRMQIDQEIGEPSSDSLSNSPTLVHELSLHESPTELGNKDESTAFVVEVDDEIDEDTMVVLLEPPIPPGFSFCSTEIMPGGPPLLSNVQLITAVRRVEWSLESRRLNQQFSAIFHNLYSSIMFKVRALTPCCICALDVDVQLPDDNELQLILTAMVALESTATRDDNKSSPSSSPSPKRLSFATDLPGEATASSEELQFVLEQKRRPLDTSKEGQEKEIHPRSVELTPMSFIPGSQTVRYLGRLGLHFIKESFTIREQGGLSVCTYIFLNEVNAMVRAHVASLGGNAVMCYKIDQCSIMETASKNQSYILISISGDVVHAKRDEEEKVVV